MALADVGFPQKEPGVITVELDFHRLPPDIIPSLVNLIAPCSPHKLKQYVKHKQGRIGITFDVIEDELPGTPYDLSV